jgi:anti-sigma factor RsiW
MKCKEVRSLLWSLYEGELPEPLSAEVRAHIDSCQECAREAHIIRELDAALKPMPVMKAPASATRSVLAAVRPLAAERRMQASRWQFAIGTTLSAAAAIILALGLLGYLPGTGEASPLKRAINTGAVSAKSALATAAGSAAKYVPYSQLVSSAHKTLAGATPWLMLGLVGIIAVLGIVAYEEAIVSRRLEAKVSAYLH